MDATEKTPVVRDCSTCGLALRPCGKDGAATKVRLCNTPKARFLLIKDETSDAGACGPDRRNWKQRAQRPVMA
jgi:hypothetical protein